MISEPGHRLGDFEIVREIGRGGMGVVFEARQISLNRKVALKVLSTGLGLSVNAVQRFQREAEAAARLHHTNIVPVYATGEDRGIHYYAMELIEGPSLDHVIRQLRKGDALLSGTPAVAPSSVESVSSAPTGAYVPADPDTQSSSSSTSAPSGNDHFERIARMMAEIADGLEYAHRQGVIHRDIKPSNLLLSPEGRLSINDFGLARVLEQPAMTVTGEFVGTPAYMSPEQITVGRAPLDHRTDIYSLGATLYELLTLEAPFAAERRDQMIAQIIHKEPRPPRARNRQIPADLETICLKAMEKDPDRRYSSAGALADDLRRYVNRFAIQARRAGLIVRLRKWVRRQPGLAAGLAGMLLLTVVAGFYAYRAEMANRQRRADQDRYAEELLTEKQQAATEKAQLAAIGCQFDEAEEALREAECLGTSAGQVRMLRGWIACCSERATEAIQDLEQAVDLLPKSVAARAMLTLAYVRVADWGKANQALREMDELSPQSPEDYIFRGIAWQLIDPRKGTRILDEAVRRRPSPLARIFRADALAHLAQDTGAVADADKAVQEVEVARQLLPGNPLSAARALAARIVAVAAYDEVGDHDKHDELLRAARADAEALKGVERMPGAMFTRWQYFVYAGEQDSIVEELRSTMESRDPMARKIAVYFYLLYLFENGKNRAALAVMDAHPESPLISAVAARAFVLADSPGGTRLAMEACQEMAKKDWYGWEWAYGQSALSLLGKSKDLAATAGDFQRKTNRFPFAESDAQLFRKLLDCWAGQAPVEALLDATAGSRRNRCRAHYFIAIGKLGEGERAAAHEEFRAAVATGLFNMWTWHMSKIMLTRLDNDPTWPPWIAIEQTAGRP